MFDTDELLSKIAVYTKKAYSSADPYLSFTFMKDNETIRIDFDRGLYTYNIHTKALKQLNEKPSYGNSDPYWMKYSPDSLYFLYASKDNLYFVGNQKKGQDTIPVQLTTDGEPNYTFNREDEGTLEGRFGAESTHWIPGSHRSAERHQSSAEGSTHRRRRRSSADSYKQMAGSSSGCKDRRRLQRHQR